MAAAVRTRRWPSFAGWGGLHEWLGVPEVIVTERTGEDPKAKTKERDVFTNRPAPQECILGAGVEDAFYRNPDALTQLITEGGNPDWDGNYRRFAEKALRVASPLASIENQGLIELRHWARGQAIAKVGGLKVVRKTRVRSPVYDPAQELDSTR